MAVPQFDHEWILEAHRRSCDALVAQITAIAEALVLLHRDTIGLLIGFDYTDPPLEPPSEQA